MASVSLNDWEARASAREASTFGRRGAAQPVNDGRTQRGYFTGTGSEYFGIWIVNIILSVLTIGIYTAWAKVRNERYFKGHTYVAGHNFDYHAKPTTILKGRIVVFIAFLAYSAIAEVAPPLWTLVLLAIYLIALPWLIVRGVSFNARMTSHRNVRFGFHGRKRHALMAFIAWPILATVSLGILLPFASRSIARFIAGHRYGTAAFHADPPLKSYYGALLKTLPLLLLPLVPIIGFALMPDMLLGAMGPVQLVLIAMSYVAFFVLPTWYHVLARNITVGSMTLDGGHSLVSDMKPLAYVAIVLTNALMVILTLGLATPWAKVRLARYKAEHTGIVPNGDLDGFVAGEQDKGDVVSGEFLDMDGFDLGL